ncbi:hypothetical protein BTVI_20271 [Pitangus sulphuratus]|nr:hypothetical protein BTVI_20271 [Pitangus sulphuratus]
MSAVTADCTDNYRAAPASLWPVGEEEEEEEEKEEEEEEEEEEKEEEEEEEERVELRALTQLREPNWLKAILLSHTPAVDLSLVKMPPVKLMDSLLDKSSHLSRGETWRDNQGKRKADLGEEYGSSPGRGWM